MIKRCFFVLLIVVLNFYFSSAQTEKGNLILAISAPLNLTGETQIGYTIKKRKGDGFETEPEKTFSINLAPRAGIFILDDLALGIDVNLGYFKLKNSLITGSDITSTQILITPFARYYFTTGKVRPFVECTGGIGFSKTKFVDDDDDFNAESTSNLLLVAGGVGIASQLARNITFDTSVGYAHFSDKEKEDNPVNEKSIINTLRLNLGFSFFLN